LLTNGGLPFLESKRNKSRAGRKVSGEMKVGSFPWILTKPRRFVVPIPGKGYLGLISPDDEILALLTAAEVNADEPA